MRDDAVQPQTNLVGETEQGEKETDERCGEKQEGNTSPKLTTKTVAGRADDWVENKVHRSRNGGHYQGDDEIRCSVTFEYQRQNSRPNGTHERETKIPQQQPREKNKQSTRCINQRSTAETIGSCFCTRHVGG